MKLYVTVKYAGLNWIVVGCYDDKLYLLSSVVVTKYNFDSKKNIYDNSKIRNYLNSEFLNKLLKHNAVEEDIISDVLLLSTEEYEQIIKDGINLKCDTDWWLRTPCDINSNYAALVNNDGTVSDECVVYDHGIRPCIWINYDALTDKQKEKLVDTSLAVVGASKGLSVADAEDNSEVFDNISEKDTDAVKGKSARRLFSRLFHKKEKSEYAGFGFVNKAKKYKLHLTASDIEHLKNITPTIMTSQNLTVDEKRVLCKIIIEVTGTQIDMSVFSTALPVGEEMKALPEAESIDLANVTGVDSSDIEAVKLIDTEVATVIDQATEEQSDVIDVIGEPVVIITDNNGEIIEEPVVVVADETDTTDNADENTIPDDFDDFEDIN